MKPTRLTIAAIVAVVLTYARAMAFTPMDGEPGGAQKLLFLHAPAAWVGLMGFFLVAVASALYLWLEEERLDRIAESAAEVAVVFTAVAVTTGSLWARASWETFWKWDPVPALTLALGVVYGVYMLLRTIIGDPVRRARVCAYLGIGGAVLVPFVQLGLYVVRTVHPPTILMNPGEASMSGDMLATLLLAFASFTLLYIALLRARYRFAVERDGAHPPETYID
jgi:heme exporter protein C